jgi:hypothetical protein
MKRTLQILALSAALTGQLSAQAIRPQQMLDRGIASLESGDHRSAAKRLKIAAFGLLGNPVAYSRALVYLAVAQERSGDREQSQKTVLKLAEIEKKTAILASLQIAPAVYGDFRKLAGSMAATNSVKIVSISNALQKIESSRATRPEPLVMRGGAQ